MADHADNGEVIHHRGLDVGLDPGGPEDAHDVKIEALVGHDEVQALEIPQGEAAPVGVLRREDGEHGVLPEGDPLVVPRLLAAGEDQVQFPLKEGGVCLGDVVGDPHLHAGGGTFLPEATDDARQPVDAHAGVGPHPDGLPPDIPGLGEGCVQPGGGVQEVPDGGGHPLALRRQADAAPAPLQKGDADLLFETVHHMRKARLGVAQDLCRTGEAPQVHRHHQGFQLLTLHPALSFRHSLPGDIHDTFSWNHYNPSLYALQGKIYTTLTQIISTQIKWV